MKIVCNELIVFWDVDDTLVIWDDEFHASSSDRTEILDPYDNKKVYLTPHRKHIKILKDHKDRGYTIVVWSAGGFKWAEAVVKALHLDEYVDLIMTKPAKIFDDLPVNELFQRVWVKP